MIVNWKVRPAVKTGLGALIAALPAEHRVLKDGLGWPNLG